MTFEIFKLISWQKLQKKWKTGIYEKKKNPTISLIFIFDATNNWILPHQARFSYISNVTLVNSDIQLILNQLKIDFVIHAADGVIAEW